MKKILIVIDMQKDFVDGALGTPEAMAIVDSVVNKIETFEGDILATYDTHFADYLETAEGKNLPVPHCIKGTDGWKLNEKVQAALDKKSFERVEKITFGSVGLPGMIEEKYDINDIEIELIGLCTDICVVSNALILKANFPEISISVDARCCAGVTPKSHSTALSAMAACHIDIV